MHLLRPLIQAFMALLFATFGSVAISTGWQQVSYLGLVQQDEAGAVDLAFAARAPPATSKNITVTGANLHAGDDVRALLRVASLGDVSGFRRSSIAPNRTGTGADNVATYNPLKAELATEEIAQGHGFQKHVVNGRNFEDLGITERYQYQAHVEHVINSPSDVRYYVDGRTVYLDAETRTVVVRNPNAGESTAFRPAEIYYDDYISTLPKRNEPYIDD